MHVSLLSTHSYATCALENGSTAFCRLWSKGPLLPYQFQQLIRCYVFSHLSHRLGRSGRNDLQGTNREGGGKQGLGAIITLLQAITCGDQAASFV